MRRFCALVSLVALGSSCSARVEVAPPLTGMRLLDPDLVLSELEGSLHLRVFARRDLRCDPARGHVLDASQNRYLQGPSVDPVTPAARCAQGFLSTAANTASPVDLCVPRDSPSTVSIAAAGTYIVLVHGQGNFPLPSGLTLPGILGAGCAEVTLAPGQQQSVTVGMHRQVPRGHCGDGMVDFDETCDLGTAMNNGPPGCTARCQSTEFAVNTTAAGDQQHPSALWATGQRLVIAYAVSNVATGEDIIARYFTSDGERETNPAVLANELALASRAQLQSAPSLAAGASGFVAAWETFEFRPSDIAAQAFGYGAPSGTSVLLSSSVQMPPSRPAHLARGPSIAASATRVVAVWQDNTSHGVRTASVPMATVLTAPMGEPMSLADGDTSGPRVVAAGAGFVAVWSASGDIFTRRIDSLGAPMEAAVRVNPIAGDTQDQPSIAALPDGSVVVAWRDALHDAQDGDGASIRWARVGADGAPEMTSRVANTTVMGDQARPTVTALMSSGGMPAVLIAWQDDPSGHIRGRLVHPDGSEVISRISGTATDFQVSTGTGGGRKDPSAAAGGPGGASFAVAWEGPEGPEGPGGAGAGIFARIFPL